MKKTCEGKDCGRSGNLGNTIFRHYAYTFERKRVIVYLCNRCEQKLQKLRRPTNAVV